MGCSGSKAADATWPRPGARSPHDASGRNGRDVRYNLVKSSRERLEDHYEIGESLGQAAMGCVVRRATKKTTGDEFACKTFNIESVKGRKEQERIRATLRSEIDLIRSLDHPNIIRAYEVFEDQGNLHLIMELCSGGDLGEYQYTEEQAGGVVNKILRAILYCHNNGVIHRDLKFENILWDSEASKGQPKLIDFGLSARFIAGTKMSERVGTVYTMAPEVLKGEYSEKADVWSIGCIAFQLIAGIPAFEGASEEETMKRLLNLGYFWPKSVQVSSEAKEFVYNMLKIDPRKRWTAQEALQSNWIKLHGITQLNSMRRHSLALRTTTSLQNFSKYGAFRKIALMVTAAHTGRDKLSEMRDMFLRIDKDQTGTLKLEELADALSDLGLSVDDQKSLFDGIDVDRSGEIHYMEFLAATLEAAGEIEEERVLEAFKHLDVDNSGKISFDNLKELLGSSQTGFSDEEIKQMLSEVSQEGDVDYEQFCEHIVAAHAHAKVNKTLTAMSVGGDSPPFSPQSIHSLTASKVV